MNKDLLSITDRNLIGDWLNARGMTGAAAEIGVMHGGYSKEVLSRWRGRRYYMVDLWSRQDPTIYREKTSDVDYDSKYLECTRIAAQDRRIVMIRDYSTQAAKEIPDASLDFVWIDANHAYDAVKADMDAWWPKMRAGALFAGHDYYNVTEWPHYCEVKRAVDDWMADHRVEFCVTEDTGWWSIKS
jgi:hypothetical protein